MHGVGPFIQSQNDDTAHPEPLQTAYIS